MDFNNFNGILLIFFSFLCKNIVWCRCISLIQDKFDTENRYIETKNVNRILRYNYIFRF